MLTHRRSSPHLPDRVIYFSSDDNRNEHYGEYVWVLKSKLPPVPKAVVEMAAEFWNISMEEAQEWVNPIDIVDSAEAWENMEFVYEVWDRFEDPGYQTPDGAVVLDWRGVDLEFLNEDEFYEKYD